MSATTDLVQRLRDFALEGWSVAVATMSEAADTIEALQAERDALRADAERYRWLKTQPLWLGWEHDFRPDEIEREVDAAMKAKP